MCKTVKYILSLIIAGLCIHNLYAQKITLSAEIIWKKKDVYLLNYDTANVPFIRFNYKNNTADSIYFYNSLRSPWDFPEYLNFDYYPGFLVNYGNLMTWDIVMTSFPDWSDNEYVVTIAKKEQYLDHLSFLLYKKGRTNINREDIVKSNEHFTLDALTSLFRMQLELDRDSTNLQYEWFDHPDKIASMEKILDYYLSQGDFKETNEKILRKIREINVYDNCVYLKPHESFSFEYDLTSFFLLKGSYHFIIKPRMPKSVMHSDNIVLPKVYKGYKLYSGQMKGVEVILSVP